jgi:protein-disulfide isomerase
VSSTFTSNQQVMKRSTLLDAAGNVSLIVLCLVAVMLWLRSDRPQAGQRTTRSEDTWHADWRTLLSSGTLVGEATAPVQLIELGDYQCPGCREFHKIWSAAHNRFERTVALTYVHYPLQYHPFAFQAAKAAECAKRQGRFVQMHAALFADQDSIGTKSFDRFADDAKVPDLEAFRRCAATTDTFPIIREGLAVGRTLKVPGTPTILVNGLMLGSPLSEKQLFLLIERVLAGNPPRRE